MQLSLGFSSLFIQILLFNSAILFYVEKRKLFWLKLVIVAILGLGLCFLVDQFTSAAVVFLLPLSINILLLWLCYKIDPFQAFFFCALGYALQNMAFCISSIISGIFPMSFSTDEPAILIYLKTQWLNWLIYILSVIASHFIYAKRMKLGAFFKIKNIKLDIVCISLILAVFLINVFWTDNSDMKKNILFRTVMILYIITSISIVLGFAAQDELIKENEVIKELLHKEEKLQKLSEDAIDTINRKCHDLKHVVGALKNGGSIDNEDLEEIEGALNTYDCFIKTGNDDLDAVLAEKYLRCKDDSITLSCLVDGKNFSFMSPADIYSLFGNLLDNAIESLEKNKEIKERTITISTKTHNKFIALKVENYCDKEQHFKNGLPTTTKDDKQNHGWGTKSILYIVKKYGGTIVFSQENNIFSVNIVIPM